MKITNIEAIHMRVEDPHIGLFDGSYDNCVIRISTDEGITGIGEVESLAPAIQGIINATPAHNHARGLKELLMGCDPSDPELLWQRMYDATDYVGRRGLMMHAMGGIDIALWDLAGKIHQKPVYELLGGAKRKKLKAYGTIYPMGRTEEEVVLQVKQATEKLNLKNIKFAADPWWLEDLTLTERLLKAARRAMGDQGIIVDAALSYKTVEEGLRLIEVLKKIDVLFLEAPLPLDDVKGHLRLSKEGILLGVGDLGLTHVNEFIEMMDLGGATICQPDMTMVGGFTGIKKIDTAAKERGKRVITHAYKSNILIAANLHFLAYQSEDELLEFSTSKSPLRWETTNEVIQVDSDGFVEVPQVPGLGVTLNEVSLKKYRRL